MNVADELKKLQDLHDSGGLSDEEFARAKETILSGLQTPPSPAPGLSPEAKEQATRQWSMFIHLGQFAGYVIPLAGLALPIVLWQVKKEELPGVDVHGKIVCNWIISAILYGIVGALLMFACFAGLVILIPLAIASIVFPIIGGIKANNGEAWPYPLAIPFLK